MSSSSLALSRCVRGHVAVAAVVAACVSLRDPQAHAETTLWERATRDPEITARQERYQLDLHRGLELAHLALADARDLDVGSVDPSTRRHIIQEARRAFERAALADPDAAEPHYCLAILIQATSLECDGCVFDAEASRKVVDEFDLFEQRAPHDPRVQSLLNDRAIMRTRLSATVPEPRRTQDLRAAMADYRALIERGGGSSRWELVYGNLAEVTMLLGDLEGAIATYRIALRNFDTSVLLGLAVALDRDERGTEARELIRGLTNESLASWEADVLAGRTFYVPAGEVHYYRGLIAEARGNRAGAVAAYLAFERSGDSPKFAQRARANITALMRSQAR